MAAQYNSKVVGADGTVYMDITDTTATAADVAHGKTFYGANGARLMGTNTGGGGDSTPIGTVIYYAGTTAPGGYLACDGTVYNIADYPKLAQFFADNYDANNYWGGDGETTFAVPNWQGEFFRAAGTQSRANQGSGAEVGEHQDATQFPEVVANFTGREIQVNYSKTVGPENESKAFNYDSIGATRDGTNYVYNTNISTKQDENQLAYFSGRPTNTSLLVCIKAV